MPGDVVPLNDTPFHGRPPPGDPGDGNEGRLELAAARTRDGLAVPVPRPEVADDGEEEGGRQPPDRHLARGALDGDQ